MPSPSQTAGETMKAAQAKAFGDASDVLTVAAGVVRPGPPRKGFVTIAVHAVSLSPSDYRMLSGAADLVKKPPAWPYIPGGDVCGTVHAVAPDEKRFHVGDRVIGTWDSFGMGGLAEYTNVASKFVEHCPDWLSFVEGAGIADSSVNAMLATEDVRLRAGESLLVLGGSGAVGTALLQLAKHKRVATIVATSTDTELVRSLGADAVVNYREEDWWHSKPVQDAAPFDVVIDCAEGVSAWKKVCEHKLVKSGRDGGRFLAVVVNQWHIEIHSVGHLLSFLMKVLCRTVSSRIYRGTVARYNMLFPAPRGDSLPRLLALAKESRLKVVIDKGSPLPFTTEGIVQAFDTMINRRGHGKVIVKIRDD